MKKSEVLNAIRGIRARSTWQAGVKFYAEWLLDNYVEEVEYCRNEWLQKNDDSAFVAPVLTEKLLLNGARDWRRYSEGGCALVSDFEICQTLATPSEQSRRRDGELPPNSRETWLDVQARALRQAAELLLSITAGGVDNEG